MRLESGPAKADRNWQILRAVLFIGFAVYFLYDGVIGYPRDTRAKAEEGLKSPNLFDGHVKYEDLRDTPAKDEFESLQKSAPTTRKQVHDALGTPQVARVESSTSSTEYFISHYGYGSVRIENDRVNAANMSWHKWYKDKSEVRQQFYWAIVPLLPGLYFLWRLFKAVRLRVVVDDEGLIYDRRRIPFAAMVSLRDYNPKGWIDLHYTEGADEEKLRLDNEKVLLFDEVVDAICQAKGFENQVRHHAEKKAREETATDEPESNEPAPDELTANEPHDKDTTGV